MGVQDAVLSLVVERPDYGYRIARRLDDEYGWSSAAVYKALGRLLERGLIEPANIPQEIEGRPKKWYRATPQGVSRHSDAVARTIRERHEILERLEGTAPENVAAVIDEYERHLLDLLEQLVSESSKHRSPIEDLVALERELVCETRLRWISLAREAIGKGLGLRPAWGGV